MKQEIKESPDPLVDDLKKLENALYQLRERVAVRQQAGWQATPSPSVQPDDVVNLARKAATVYAGRRARERVFNGFSLFGEPAWDIMLYLFIAEYMGLYISVNSATIAAAVPQTTGLRWIAKMVEEGLVDRKPDPDDGRRSHLRLTPVGLALTSKALAAA